MKKNLLLIGFMAITIASACKKQPVGPESQIRQIKLLTKITRTQEGGTPMVTNISYDNKNRVIELSGATSQKYIYTDDLITSGTVGTFSRTVTYNNTTPVSIDYGRGLVYTLTFENGHVTKATSNGTNPIVSQFIYTGNNVTTFINGANITKYVYGTKKNPYCDARFKYGFDTADLDFLSENEVVESIIKDSPRLGATYTYVYDADGYPKSAIEKRTKPNDATAFINTTITYEYDVRTVAK